MSGCHVPYPIDREDELQHIYDYVADLKIKNDENISKINELIDKIAAIANYCYAEKKPYQCPCCKGEGQRASALGNPGIYKCMSCDGKGVLWN